MTICDGLKVTFRQFWGFFQKNVMGTHKLPLKLTTPSRYPRHLRKSNNFHNGISPLNEALQNVWDTLISEAPTQECRKNLKFMLNNGVDDHLYGLRVNDSIHWGPYGILVKDVAFNTDKLHQHDYLAMPELVCRYPQCI